MTGEEKFKVDLEGYLVIKNVLTDDEVAEMNEIIDNGDRQGPPSLWVNRLSGSLTIRKFCRISLIC